MQFYKLRINEVIKETNDTTSIIFTLPSSLETKFSWDSGQHVMIRVNYEGEYLTRCYSISSWKSLKITVKRIDKGRVSHLVNNSFKVNDLVEVSAPIGKPLINDNNIHTRKTLYLFAAGSGITAFFSMIENILVAQPYSRVNLFYRCRNEKHAIFLKQAKLLEKLYSNRFNFILSYSQPRLFDAVSWHKGAISQNDIADYFTKYAPSAQRCEYHVCGPTSFLNLVSQHLTSLDVPEVLLHKQSFEGNEVKADNIQQAKLDVIHPQGTNTIEVNKGESLLSAMKQQGIAPAYSCESGLCGQCQCLLLDGDITMKNNYYLNEPQEKASLILSCQSYPLSSYVRISHEGN